MKVWSGSAWAEKPAKVWSGSAWVTKPTKVWDGVQWVVKPYVPPVGGGVPDFHLVTSFLPGVDRQDHDGEVGFIFKSIVNKSYSWLGLRCATGNTGLHRIHLYDWLEPMTPLRTVDIDLTGKAVNEWGWGAIAPVQLVASQFYVLMKETFFGGPLWSDDSSTQLDLALSDFWKSTYRVPGGAINQNTGNWQYVGLDIGGEDVAPPFVPTDIAGLSVWLDASQLALADGAAVSPWPNLVAGGSNGTVMRAPAPVLKTNILNGKSIVRMTAEEGRFVWNGTTGVSSPWTMVFIARDRTVRINPARIVGATYPPMNLIFGFYGAEADVFYAGAFGGTSKPTVAGQWEMYSSVCADASGGTIDFWSKSVALPGLSGGGQTWNNSLILGGYDFNGTDNQQADADYAELLLYNRGLSDPERQSVEAYLRAKWGL